MKEEALEEMSFKLSPEVGVEIASQRAKGEKRKEVSL